MSVGNNRLDQETSPYLLQHRHNRCIGRRSRNLALARREGRYCSRSATPRVVVPCDGP
jgi:hypothetical protein